jgi:itaconate CoA-transferase
VYLGIQNEREWRRFCEVVLEDPALAADPRFGSNAKRVEHRDVLDGLIASRVATLSAEALIERLDRAQIANARMNTIHQFLAHPQLAARDRWREVDSPAGPLRALLPPVTFDRVEPAMGPVPDVGQHTDQILAELGIDASTVAAWRGDGVV